jgi:hypothetical protein
LPTPFASFRYFDLSFPACVILGAPGVAVSSIRHFPGQPELKPTPADVEPIQPASTAKTARGGATFGVDRRCRGVGERSPDRCTIGGLKVTERPGDIVSATSHDSIFNDGIARVVRISKPTSCSQWEEFCM